MRPPQMALKMRTQMFWCVYLKWHLIVRERDDTPRAPMVSQRHT